MNEINYFLTSDGNIVNNRMSFKVGLTKSYKFTVLLQLERCLLILLPSFFTALEARTKG